MAGNDILFAALMGISLSACCGIRAFIPPLAMSLLALSGYIAPASGFEWMGSWEAALAFGIAAILELLADKYPGVDHVLDAVGLVLKPAAGALVAWASLSGSDPLLAACLGIILGGGLAEGFHLVRAKLRLLSTGLTAGIANPVISMAEDAAALFGTLLSVLAPLLGAALVVALICWLVPRIRRMRQQRRAAIL
jgi:uncharacterized membrane protein